MSQHAKELHENLKKVMRRFGRQCRGQGKVFVSTIGHKLEDLDHPDVRTLTERGLLWASR